MEYDKKYTLKELGLNQEEKMLKKLKGNFENILKYVDKQNKIWYNIKYIKERRILIKNKKEYEYLGFKLERALDGCNNATINEYWSAFQNENYFRCEVILELWGINE